MVAGQSEPALDEAIFAAAEGELVGPIQGDAGFYVIQVEAIEPGVTRGLEEEVQPAAGGAPAQTVADQIRATLVAARQQEVAQAFQEDFQNKWIKRTLCADGFRIDRCSNAEPPPDPCTEDVAETQGCRRAGAVHAADRAWHERSVRHAARARPAAGPDQLPAARRRRPGWSPAARCRLARSRPATAPPGGAAPPGTAPPRRLSRPLDELERLDEITRRLRRECPWDREQDERSIVPHTVEEAYELADAAQRGDDEKLRDELGDVLFQVVFLVAAARGARRGRRSARSPTS